MLSNYSFGKKVEEKTVLKVINKVLKDEGKELSKIDELVPLGLNNDTLLYVAKFKKGGFLILSADFTADPVLGMAWGGEFNLDSIPSGLMYLLDKYQQEISFLRKNEVEPTDKVKSKWDKYTNDDLKSAEVIQTVTPLIQENWDQGKVDASQSSSYNRYCPTGCYAGCTAVAMAKVLYYWKYDVDQTGSNTESGETVNFGEELYHWNGMTTDEVAKLIWHAGVSCNMNYCWAGDESMKDLGGAKSALIDYWGMSNVADVKDRIWHLNTWEDMLKEQLDNSMPVIYCAGELAGAWHTWVIAGYNAYGGFWCNWGLYAYYDGYYSLGNFHPRWLTYDSGKDFNNYEHAIFDLYPETEVCSNISGPNTLTSTSVAYYVDNIADYYFASWTTSANINVQYGGSDWVAVYSTSPGTGWIQGSYNINGTIYTSAKKYVTCQ